MSDDKYKVNIQPIPDDPIQSFWITKLGKHWNQTAIFDHPLARNLGGIHRTHRFIRASAELKELLHMFLDDMLQRNRLPDEFRKGNDQLFIDPFYAAGVIEVLIGNIRHEVRRLYPSGRYDNEIPPLYRDYAEILMDGDLPSMQYEKDKASGVCSENRTRGGWWKKWIGWPHDQDG